jgi:hypothetical protein
LPHNDLAEPRAFRAERYFFRILQACSAWREYAKSLLLNHLRAASALARVVPPWLASRTENERLGGSRRDTLRMERTMRKAVIAVAALVVTGASAAGAQTAAVAVEVTVPTILVLSSTGGFTFPSVTESAYDAQQLESTSGPTLSHRANVPYRITINAQSGGTFGFVAAAGRSDADPNKPVGDLRLLAEFGGAAVNAQLGAQGSPTDWYTRATRGPLESGEVTARLALDWELDAPGTYSTVVVFTMVAQ